MTDITAIREHLKSEIKNIPNGSYNAEQKQIACDILDSANETNIEQIYTFITQRVKLGFTFDVAPEVNHNCISLIKYNEKLSFGNELGNRHKLIIGENYDALKNLLATYTIDGHGLIDVIYIDPPYNTESARGDGNDYKDAVVASKFIYRDKFTRNGWLNMMRERLIMARKLLSDTGVIFISIDDNEQAYLKVLCDEIFGEDNFVGILNSLDNLKGKENDSYLSYTSHYVLIYMKHKSEEGCFNKVASENCLEEKYNKIDENGNLYVPNSFKKTGASKKREERPFMFYPVLEKQKKLSLISKTEYNNIYQNGSFNDKFLTELCNKYTSLGYNVILPKDKNGDYLRWTSGYDTCSILIARNELEFFNNAIYQKKYPKDIEIIENSVYGTPKNFIYQKEFSKGTIDLQNIGLTFSNPKSVSLIKYLIKLVPNNQNAIILDFFAGSGTTGQAVMELNQADGGNRKCILVSNNENNIATNITRERLYRVVMGVGSNGESFEWKYSPEKPYLNNNKWDVFDLETTELRIDDFEKADKLLKQAHVQFKLLNPEYESKSLNIYNQLASLNPYKK